MPEGEHRNVYRKLRPDGAIQAERPVGFTEGQPRQGCKTGCRPEGHFRCLLPCHNRRRKPNNQAVGITLPTYVEQPNYTPSLI